MIMGCWQSPRFPMVAMDEVKHDPETGQFTSGGSGGGEGESKGPTPPSAKLAALGKAVNAPSHATLRGSSGGWAESGKSHADVHKDLTRAGFTRVARPSMAGKSMKMGHSTARYGWREQKSSYSHPDGHTAEVKTKTPTQGMNTKPTSYVDIVAKE